jgi:hypothetical protein
MDLQVQIRPDLPAHDDRLTSRLATLLPAMLRVSPIAFFLCLRLLTSSVISTQGAGSKYMT